MEPDSSPAWLLYFAMGNSVNLTEICCVVSPMTIQQIAGTRSDLQDCRVLLHRWKNGLVWLFIRVENGQNCG